MRTVAIDTPWLTGRLAGASLVREGLVPGKPRLLDAVREAIRLRHYSRRTERAYVAWIRRYILFHDKRHPYLDSSRKGASKQRKGDEF
jgi:hypothetical protein